jgi:uncharacterized membrane protein
MEKKHEEDPFLELGLLLFVTGLVAVLLVTCVIVALANEVAIEAFPALLLLLIGVVSGLGAAVFVLARRLLRFIRHG